MFGSISKATPNTTVTSSFVADEACTISITYPIRVNGASASSPATLAVNDKIEVDVPVGNPLSITYVDYQYNGNTSEFAVVASSGSTRPLLQRSYRNLYWPDYAPTASHAATSRSSSGTLTPFGFAGSSTLNANAVALLDPASQSISFHLADSSGSTYTRSSFTSTTYPIAYTYLFNGATQANDIYVLQKNGVLTKIALNMSQTASTIAGNTNLKCLFNDGASLWSAGTNVLRNFIDLNTYLDYSHTFTFVEGVGAGGNLFLVTNDGRLVRFTNGVFTVIYTGPMLGTPVVYQNQIVVPSPEEYKLIYFNLDGTQFKTVDTGNYLPFAIGTDGNVMTVASCNTPDVMVFNGSTMSVVTFQKNVTYAVPVGSYIIADHYLAEFSTTYPPDPPVTGLNFKKMVGPVNVDNGSGDFTISTVGVDLRVASSAMASVSVNYAMSGTIVQNGQTIAVQTRSVNGRKSVPVIIGVNAFDYQVTGVTTTAFSTQITIPNLVASPTVTWNLTVPTQVVNAPIALSYGNLVINNTAFDGSKQVNAGDSLTITINLPTGVTTYYSVLSIADSQYGLIVNNAADVDLNMISFVQFDESDLTTTFQVSETGTYYLPDYTNVSATVNGTSVTFPTQMNINDTVVLTHVMSSSYRYDVRTTVMMGPSTNYVASNRTLVYDIPSPPLDFGYVHNGIPDFPSITDTTVTIAGLSPNWFSDLSGVNLQFSVNGGAWTDTAHVQNGDKVQLQYTVINLWDGTRPVEVLSLEAGLVDCGIFHIDPPLGIDFDPGHQDSDIEQNVNWIKFVPSPVKSNAQVGANASFAYLTYPINSPELQQSHTNSYPINAPELQQSHTNSYPINAPEIQQSHTNSYPINAPEFIDGSHDAGGVAPVSSWTPGAELNYYTMSQASNYVYPYRPVLLNSRIYLAYDEYIETDIQHLSESAFGYSIQPNEITPQYLNDAGISGPGVPPVYNQGNDNETIYVQPVWKWILQDNSWSYDPDNRFENKPLHEVPLNPILTSPYFYSRDLPLFVTQDRFKLTDNVMPVVITASFLTNQLPAIAINPLFVPSIVLPVRIMGYWDAAHVSTPPASVPAKVQPAVLDTPSYHGVAVVQKLWDTLLPDQTGGYDTETEAANAGATIAGSLTVTTYKQPEGTFSYVVQRETNLVCPIKPTVSIIKAWYMGGG